MKPDDDGKWEQRCQEDPRFRALDQNMVESIENEIINEGKNVTWDDIAGLKAAKS